MAWNRNRSKMTIKLTLVVTRCKNQDTWCWWWQCVQQLCTCTKSIPKPNWQFPTTIDDVGGQFLNFQVYKYDRSIQGDTRQVDGRTTCTITNIMIRTCRTTNYHHKNVWSTIIGWILMTVERSIDHKKMGVWESHENWCNDGTIIANHDDDAIKCFGFHT